MGNDRQTEKKQKKLVGIQRGNPDFLLLLFVYGSHGSLDLDIVLLKTNNNKKKKTHAMLLFIRHNY